MSGPHPTGVALWRQVADGIERGIADGELRAGARLQGENEIAEAYGVNRHTVRRALAALAERGLVRAERGSGTFVETPKLAYPLHSRTRFSEIVGAGGREPRGRFISSAIEVAPDAAKRLRLKRGTPLIRIDALRLADRVPMCIATTWLAGDRFADAGPLYARLRSMTKVLSRYGITDYRRQVTSISACLVNAADATKLELAPGRPILIVNSTDVDAAGSPLLTTHARFAAERVDLVVESN